MRARYGLVAAILKVASAAPEGLEAQLQKIAEEKAVEYNCSFSIAYRDATGEATAAAGVVDFSTNKQASTSDGYAFGSVTKVLTGSSILKLVGEGHFSLDSEVAPLVDPILKKMAEADPSQGFSSMAELWGAENVTGTTIRQLLGMQSGVPDFDTATPCLPLQAGCVPSDPLRSTLYADPQDSWDPVRLMKVPWVAHHWTKCDKGLVPGMKPFCYSSTNFMLLGLILASHANATWTTFDQSMYLPEALKHAFTFANSGSPSDYTPVHGYDRTTYNMPKGKENAHDNWEVDGVFSGWTASDVIANASTVAGLTWEVYGPPHSIAPPALVAEMVPSGGLLSVYGLATHNLAQNTGQKGEYGVAYGHLGATYGYQSVTAYFPKLNFVITVATNIETDFQRQPADAMCFAYNAAASLILKRTIKCTYTPGSYYGGGCKCDPIEDEEVELMV